MSERRNRRDTGTYLFVKEGSRRGGSQERPPRASEGVRDRVRQQLASDSMMIPLDEITAERLRHLRPRLQPEDLDPRLVFFLEPDGAIAEEYREVAARLVAEHAGVRRILVASPQMGSGKTVTALNIACALAESRRVTVLDLHLTRPGVAAAFGLKLETGLVELTHARRRDHRAPLDVVLLSDQLAALPLKAPLGPDEAEALLGKSELARIVEELAATSDVLLVDGPAVLEERALAGLWPLVDASLLVVRPSELGSGAYERALDLVAARPVVGTLVNGAPDPPRRR